MLPGASGTRQSPRPFGANGLAKIGRSAPRGIVVCLVAGGVSASLRAHAKQSSLGSAKEGWIASALRFSQ